MPDAAICVSVSHRIVETPNAAALIPVCAQGDTEDMPNPVPSIKRISESAEAAAAPAKIAPHETALDSADERSAGMSSTSGLIASGSTVTVCNVFIVFPVF